MIEAQDIAVELGGRRVLDGISLAVPRGQLVAVLGPNGAGKTTLLRALAGLLPYQGRVSIAGQDLARISPMERARAVAYLPQGHQADWPLAARDVVAIGRMPHGGGPGHLGARDAAAVDGALAAADARHLADRPVTGLSGGERARVMLARALAVQAPVLLADEPVAALDPGHQLAVMDLLRQAAAGGGTVVACLHDLTMAARFADRVVVVVRGRLKADGPAADVLGTDLLRRVFDIEAVRIEHDGQPVIVPWATGADARSRDSRR